MCLHQIISGKGELLTVNCPMALSNCPCGPIFWGALIRPAFPPAGTVAPSASVCRLVVLFSGQSMMGNLSKKMNQKWVAWPGMVSGLFSVTPSLRGLPNKAIFFHPRVLVRLTLLVDLTASSASRPVKPLGASVLVSTSSWPLQWDKGNQSTPEQHPANWLKRAVSTLASGRSNRLTRPKTTLD